MRLESLRIENFRSFRDETISFDSYTCLVGPNGCGKSTVLTALNVFFRNAASASTNLVCLCEEDFHHGNTASPIKITLTFTGLPEQAREELKHYFRQDKLVVCSKAVWNTESKSADVKQYGIRNVMIQFAEYFKAEEDGKKAAELKEIYDRLQKEFAELPKAGSGPARVTALREFEEAHPELCSLIESPTQFFGFTKGANLLNKYIQWVYVPAVKDASSEQEEGSKGALKDLLDRTVRTKVNFKDPIAALKLRVEEDYRKLIDAEKHSLQELEKSIHHRFKEWASPNAMLRLGWHYDNDKSVVVNEPYARASIGEDNFIGEVARLGHGMQRSFLVAILHELASLNSEQGPTLLLGFEEPELYQHPPQAQHMASVLEDLASSQKTNTQVIVCTHSPHFVSSKGFENVRVVRKHQQDKCSLVAGTNFVKVEEILANALNMKADKPSATMASIEQIMQPSQKELFFTRVAILVEGPEDIGFIATHLVLNNQWSEFRRLGCHFIVTGSKTNMSRPLAIAKELCIRTFAVFDADSDRKQEEKNHIRDNSCIFNICDIKDFDPLPKDTVLYDNCVACSPRIDAIVKKEAGKLWEEAVNHVKNVAGYDGVSNKNKMFIAAVMEQLAQRGFVSESLSAVTKRILAYAERMHPEPEPVLTETVTAESFVGATATVTE